MDSTAYTSIGLQMFLTTARRGIDLLMAAGDVQSQAAYIIIIFFLLYKNSLRFGIYHLGLLNKKAGVSWNSCARAFRVHGLFG